MLRQRAIKQFGADGHQNTKGKDRNHRVNSLKWRKDEQNVPNSQTPNLLSYSEMLFINSKMATGIYLSDSCWSKCSICNNSSDATWKTKWISPMISNRAVKQCLQNFPFLFWLFLCQISKNVSNAFKLNSSTKGWERSAYATETYVSLLFLFVALV